MVGMDRKKLNLVVVCLFVFRSSVFVMVDFDCDMLGIIVRYWISLILKVVLIGMFLVV